MLSVVIPCEGGGFYALGRNLTSRRLFEKRYGTSYDWFIHTEHINTCWEILEELRKSFQISRATFWPFRVPVIHANAVIGLHCRQK